MNQAIFDKLVEAHQAHPGVVSTDASFGVKPGPDGNWVQSGE